MIKFVSLAVASAFFGLAGVAQAADVATASDVASVRVPVAGKSAAQVQHDILAAAHEVCARLDADCRDQAAANAMQQYWTLTHRSASRADAAFASAQADGPTTIRVRVAGKSPEAVEAAIQTAAGKVCAAATGGDSDSALRSCVEDAVSDARRQLHYMVRASN
jgi:hypothetical protein